MNLSRLSLVILSVNSSVYSKDLSEIAVPIRGLAGKERIILTIFEISVSFIGFSSSSLIVGITQEDLKLLKLLRDELLTAMLALLFGERIEFLMLWTL